MTHAPEYEPPYKVQPQGRPPGRRWYQKKRFLIPIAILVVLVGFAIVTPDAEEKATVAEAPASGSPEAIKEDAKRAGQKSADTAKAVAPKLTQEERFVSLVEKAREAADDADNDFQKRLPLTKRDKDICKLLDSKQIKNWTGEVKTLDTNGDGLGVLGIEIGDEITVSTNNNAFSDYEDHTLIKTSSPLFDTMSSLEEGARVTFSGSFIRDSESCILEQSLTDEGSTQTPTFTFKFSKIAKD